MNKGWKVFGLFLLLGVLMAEPVMAVTVVSAEMPFDAIGQRAQNSARNTWAPLIITLGILALGTAVIIGLQRISSQAVRTIVGIGIIVIAITGAGLATLFPGIITSVILP